MEKRRSGILITDLNRGDPSSLRLRLSYDGQAVPSPSDFVGLRGINSFSPANKGLFKMKKACKNITANNSIDLFVALLKEIELKSIFELANTKLLGKIYLIPKLTHFGFGRQEPLV